MSSIEVGPGLPTPTNPRPDNSRLAARPPPRDESVLFQVKQPPLTGQQILGHPQMVPQVVARQYKPSAPL